VFELPLIVQVGLVIVAVWMIIGLIFGGVLVALGGKAACEPHSPAGFFLMMLFAGTGILLLTFFEALQSDFQRG
jgi:hypothetical protein